MSQLFQRSHILAYDTCFFPLMHSLDGEEEQQEALTVLVGLGTDSCQGSRTCHLFVPAVAAEGILAAVEVSAVAVVPVWFSGSNSHTCQGTSDGLGWHSWDTLLNPGCQTEVKLEQKAVGNFGQTVAQHPAVVQQYCCMCMLVCCRHGLVLVLPLLFVLSCSTGSRDQQSRGFHSYHNC